MRLAVIASHPIQYQAPLFRELAQHVDLQVLFAHRATAEDQSRAGFGVAFEWDVDLLDGYAHRFLDNVSTAPNPDHFAGCDTPGIHAALRDGRFDAVLIQGWHLKSFLQALWAAKRLALPTLCRGDSQLATPRSAVKKAIKAVAYPLFLRRFDAALYVGIQSRAYWRRYGYPESRLFFSPHAVDADWFAARATPEARAATRAKLGVAPEARAVLFAGKLIARKRPFDCVEALAMLQQKGLVVELIVAGSGPLESALVEIAASFSVPLRRLGFVNQSEMPAAYAAADVLVLPSSGQETWGLVANEALACGRPIILSDAVGAAPDLAADGRVGSIYPAGNVKALAAALEALFNAPPEADKIAAISARHSLAAAADGILAAAAFAARRH